MFKPTHALVSRAKKTPVQAVRSMKGFFLITEQEWRQGRKPAFEILPKLGLFCKGVQIVGYHLQPLATEISNTTSDEVVAAHA